jgi:hypothetical protein
MERAVGVGPALHDLDALEESARMLGRPRVAHRRHDEARSVAPRVGRAAGGQSRRGGRSRREIAAHRYTLRITLPDELARRAQIGREVPAAEEADRHARAARAVDLPSAQRSEEGLAGVLLGPDRREPAEVVAGLGTRASKVSVCHSAVAPGVPVWMSVEAI